MKQKRAEKRTLKILYLEDAPRDIEIVRQLLSDVGYNLRMDSTEKKEEYIVFLRNNSYDIILSDFTLPGFDAFGALESAREIRSEVPFICVSGSIGEDTAIELIKRGAVDYILKDRLVRLPFVVQRALAEAEEKESRRKAEKALRESEERFRTLFTFSPDALYVHVKNRVAFANPAFSTLLGAKDPSQLIGKSVFEIIHPEYHAKVRERWNMMAGGESAPALEEKFVRLDGSVVDVEVSAVNIDWEGSKGVQVIARDITERKRTQEELTRTEALLGTALENLPLIFYVIDPDGTFNRSIGAGLKALGLKPNQVVGQSAFDIYKDFPNITESVKKALNGERVQFESNVAGSSFENFLVPFFTAKNVFVGIVGVALDITDRKRTEERISLLAHTVRSIRECVSITDMNDTILFVNDAFLTTYGFEEHEILGKNINIIGSPNNPRALLGEVSEAAREAGWHGELLNRTKDGREFPVELSTSIVHDEHGKAVALVGVATDITERKIAEQTQLLLSTALESTANGVVITDVGGNIAWVNNAFEKMTGYSGAEVKGQNLRILKSGKQDGEFYAQLWQTITAGNVWTGELINKRKDGRLYTDETTITPLRNKKGEITNFIAIKQDITERKRAEEQLRLSDEIIKRANALILIADAEGRITYASPSVKTILGFETTEILGDGWWRSTRDDRGEQEEERMQAGRLARGESPLTEGSYESKIKSKDGETHWILWQDARGAHQELIGVGQDITERKKVEAALRDREARLMDSEKRFRAVWENSADGMRITDKEGTIISVNDAYCRLMKARKEELEGRPFNIVYKSTEEGHQRSAELYRQRFTNRVIGPVQEAGLGLISGDTMNVEISNAFIEYEGGGPWLLSIFRDITERKRAEEALLYEQSLLRAIMDNMPDHIYFKDKESRFLRISRSQANHFGLDDPSQAVGKSDFDFFAESHARPAFEDEKKIMESGVAIIGFEEKETWPDGSETWVSTTKVPLQDAQGQIVGTFGISRDITDRVRSEQALRESEEKYKSLFDRNLAATFVSTPSGKLIDCNPAYLEMFGFESHEQAMTTNMSRLYSDPKDRAMLLTMLHGHNKAENVQLRMVKLDRTPMYIIANVVGKFDDHGELVQKTGYLIDDTKRHRLERELIQSQKLESLGILAGGIAHDFNNILGILMGHVSLLERIKDDPELHKTSLNAIDTALKRGTGLVRQLLTFARKTDVAFGPILVNDIVKELLRLLRETLPKTIDVVAELGPEIPATVGDGGQIHQIMLNLCVNARDAMPAGGRLQIRTSVVDRDRVRQRFPNAVSDKYVAIEVHDTGTGMDEATKTRIFEPFFTTKEAGKGTGLGLAVVFGVVQTHKGYIDVESEVGKGTTFCVYLPLEVPQTKGEAGKRTLFEESRGGNETILFVEDEALLYETSRLVLASKGYNVLYAKDGLEALEVYRKHFKEIHLVLTDMDMPKLGGEKLVKAFLDINPRLKIIFASGFVEPEVKARVFKLGAKEFLAKPYDPVAMLSKVREVLDSED